MLYSKFRLGQFNTCVLTLAFIVIYRVCTTAVIYFSYQMQANFRLRVRSVDVPITFESMPSISTTVCYQCYINILHTTTY